MARPSVGEESAKPAASPEATPKPQRQRKRDVISAQTMPENRRVVTTAAVLRDVPTPRVEDAGHGQEGVAAEEADDVSVYELVEATGSSQEPIPPERGQSREPPKRQERPAPKELKKLFLKPRNRATPTDLKEAIGNLPTKTNAVVTAIDERQGHVVITCHSGPDAAQLTTFLRSQAEFNKLAEVVERPDTRVKLILRNVPPKSEEQEVLNALRIQNARLRTEMEVVSKKPTRDNRRESWIVLAPRNLEPHLTKRGPFYLGLRQVECDRYRQLHRCDRCQDLGHESTECRRQHRCANCALAHRTDHCQEREVACVNCWTSNRRQSTTYRTDHRASDNRCPIYIETKRALLRDDGEREPKHPKTRDATATLRPMTQLNARGNRRQQPANQPRRGLRNKKNEEKRERSQRQRRPRETLV